MKNESMYIIKESELLTFHMAAVMSTRENEITQEMVDNIRKREYEGYQGIPKDIVASVLSKYFPGSRMCLMMQDMETKCLR